MPIYWLIDGTYMYKCSKSLGLNLSYKRLREKIERTLCGEESLVAYYFNTVSDSNNDSSFLNWMQIAKPNGPQIRIKKYDLKQKRVKCASCSDEFDIPVQKGVDIGMVTAAFKFMNDYTTLILSTGDGDFKDAIEYLNEIHSKRIIIVGFNGVSPDIQPYCDKILYINNFLEEVKDDR